MNRIVPRTLALGLWLAAVSSGWAAEPNPDQAKAVAEIKRWGGKVTVDEKTPDKAVTGVDLTGIQGLEYGGLEYLEGLTRLQTLSLARTEVNDAGLGHLEGLTRLQTLSLERTQVGDAALGHLKGLTRLKGLNLAETKITDAGLEHLTGLTQLRSLDHHRHQSHRGGREEVSAGFAQLRHSALTSFNNRLRGNDADMP